MFNRVIIILLFLIIVLSNTFSDNYTDFIKKNIENQKKIKTLITIGKMQMQVMDINKNITQETNSNISIYINFPDKFKLEIDSPLKCVIIQNGDIMRTKLKDSGQIYKNKALLSPDLFKKYYTSGVEDLKNNTIIESQKIVNKNGQQYTKFKLEYNNEELNFNELGNIPIDYLEVYFNKDGMFVRNCVISEDQEIMKTDIKYIKKNNIFLITELKTIIKTTMGSMVNIISYNGINVNIKILDKEFDMK